MTPDGKPFDVNHVSDTPAVGWRAAAGLLNNRPTQDLISSCRAITIMALGTVPKRVTPGIPMYSRHTGPRGRSNDRHCFATFMMGERAQRVSLAVPANARTGMCGPEGIMHGRDTAQVQRADRRAG